jgi:aspartate dehydrogenase
LGLGFDETHVTIICDPTTERNAHTLVVKGDFGELRCETRTSPPQTPIHHLPGGLVGVAAIKGSYGMFDRD